MARMSDRQAELVALFQEHFDAEQENNIERTMRTLAPDIVYEHPFREHQDTIQGFDAVRAYYRRSWANNPFREIRIVRSWLSGPDTLLAETEATVGKPGEEKLIRNLAVGVFRDGLLVREIVYNGPYVPLE
jgi:predicted SnoaL-like aldol condensation-catalyzing enzyme